MENKQEEIKKILDNKYEILNKIDEGGYGKVYKVKDLNSGKIYAAKIPIKDKCDLDNEYNSLNRVKNSFVINIIEKGEGRISKNGELSKSKIKYLIIELAGKGDLFKYINKIRRTFNEKYSKVIFSKILKGVLACHKSGICHRDLKLENILLDDQFNPKIGDFGYATLLEGSDGSGKLKTFVGTRIYAAPEILLNKGYDGIKADIFSLGIILLSMVTGKKFYDPLFLEKKNSKGIIVERNVLFNTNYKDLISKKWFKFYNQIPETSQEFKELINKMVSFEPENRISIEDILNHSWLKEIRELNEEKIKDLETEIQMEFLKREEEIKELSETLKTGKENEDENNKDKFNAKGIDDVQYFPLGLDLKYENTGLNMKDFMKIEGNIKPHKFMNALVNNIKENNECSIETGINTYKFLINFGMKEEEDEDKVEEEELENLEILNMKGGDEGDEEEDEKFEEFKKYNSLSIQVKLFKSYNIGYIVRFVKKSGIMDDYYKNLNKIKEVIKFLL